jgi:hypothetical protein
MGINEQDLERILIYRVSKSVRKSATLKIESIIVVQIGQDLMIL